MSLTPAEACEFARGVCEGRGRFPDVVVYSMGEAIEVMKRGERGMVVIGPPFLSRVDVLARLVRALDQLRVGD